EKRIAIEEGDRASSKCYAFPHRVPHQVPELLGQDGVRCKRTRTTPTGEHLGHRTLNDRRLGRDRTALLRRLSELLSVSLRRSLRLEAPPRAALAVAEIDLPVHLMGPVASSEHDLSDCRRHPLLPERLLPGARLGTAPQTD